MTYKEFENEIKILGLVCEYKFLTVLVYESNDTLHPLAYVCQTTLNKMTTTSDISVLTVVNSSRLLDLCYKLARTPLYQRGEIK